MIECPHTTTRPRWLLVAVLRPSNARTAQSLLGEVPDTTSTQGLETTVGPTENAFIITIVGSVLS
jgi:hypothetical protein